MVGAGGPVGGPPLAAASSPDHATRVASVLRRLAPRAPERISGEHRLIEDLGFDSLALVKTVVALEDEFGLELPQERLHELRTATVADVSSLLEAAERDQ